MKRERGHRAPGKALFLALGVIALFVDACVRRDHVDLSEDVVESATLPDRINLQELPAHPAGVQTPLSVAIEITLSPGEKINAEAPSRLLLWEGSDDTWSRMSQVDLRPLAGGKGESSPIRLETSFTPKKQDSLLVLEAQIYHCRVDGKGVCAISSFRAPLERKPSEGMLRIAVPRAF